MVISSQALYFVMLALRHCGDETGIGTQCCTMWGPVRSCVVAALVSQHVPMSLRARTTADIIILYNLVSWNCERLFLHWLYRLPL